jgi:hypothetical protein
VIGTAHHEYLAFEYVLNQEDSEKAFPLVISMNREQTSHSMIVLELTNISDTRCLHEPSLVAAGGWKD